MRQTIRNFLLFLESRNRSIIVFILLLVLVSGTIYSFYLGDNLRFWDENEYYEIANNIVSNNIFSLDSKTKTAYRPPGYPYFLSLFISLGASITLLRILNFAALACSIYLVYRITIKIDSPLSGLFAAILVIFYPVQFYLAGILAAQSVGTTLFLSILLLLSEEEEIHTKKYILAGLLFGCLILTVPSFLFSLFIITLLLLIPISKKSLKISAITLITALLVVFTWSARNYYVFDSFVFISTHTGMVLLDGNSEGTTPTSGSKTDTSKYTANMPENLNEVERDRYLKSKAIEYMLDNKIRTIKMYFLKALNYYNFTNEIRGEISGYTKRFKDIIMLLTYGPLLVFFLLRLFFIKRFKPSKSEILFITLYLANPFFIAIFLTRIRYRLPFDFLMIMVVAMFISKLMNFTIKRNEN